MGIRTTASDPVHFIYDSVTGLAIGPCWQDAEEMEDFLNWWSEWDFEDMRRVDNPYLVHKMREFMEKVAQSSIGEYQHFEDTDNLTTTP
jgi:hypothetical protein